MDGLDDVWCGPFGTQLSWHASQPVYKFLGAEGKNALFFREGRHEYNREDWNTALDFCDNIFYGMERPANYTTRVSHVYIPKHVDPAKMLSTIHKIDFTPFFDYPYDD
jgi:hypothetical protein